MISARRLGHAGLLLILATTLWACDADPTPTPAGPPSPTSRPLTPAPSATATVPPSPTVPPTPSATPSPTLTPVPTATEGPVRTPVGGAAGPEFAVALAAMDAAPSYRYSLDLELGPPAVRYVLTGTGQYQAPAAWDTTFNALGFSSELLTISDTTYVRNYGVWTKGPPDATLFPMGAPPAVGNVLGLLTYATDAGLVGEGNETLAGAPARHFRFRLPAPHLGSPLPALAPTGGDLWTDPTTHRFRRLLLAFGNATSAPNDAGTLQFDFQDYNAAITLTPPPLP
ncbi:MAG: hypothetical protein M3Z04_11550 [Chloroflexota bacterium]|nr:hypothetical protein [Chloroflexota bacterium]